MFVMVMSMLLPVLIMLASYIAIVVVIFRLSSFLFPYLALLPCTLSPNESLKETGREDTTYIIESKSIDKGLEFYQTKQDKPQSQYKIHFLGDPAV